MDRRESIYLDSSVPSAYYDEREPARQNETKEFWKKLNDYRVYISELTLAELGKTKGTEKDKLLSLVEEISIAPRTPECETLADKYVAEGCIPEKHRDDAVHIAIATVNEIDIIISWNFDHIVKLKTRKMVNAINTLNGYKSIEIIAPLEL